MKFIIILLTALSVLTSTATAQSLSRIAAIVNDEMISTYQLEQELNKALRQNLEQPTPEQLAQLKNTLLEKMIQDKLLKQRAEELGLEIPESDVDAAIAEVREKNGLTEDGLQKALAAQGMTMTGYREQIKNELLHYKLLGREVNYKVMVTSSEVRDYFEQHRDSYTKPGRISLSRISFRLQDRNDHAPPEDVRQQAELTARELRQGIPAAEILARANDFADGGIMHDLVFADLAQPLQQALQGLAPGEVTAPLEMNGQIHVFLVMAREGGETGSYELVKEDIERLLKNHKAEQRFDEWARELRAKAHIEIRI